MIEAYGFDHPADAAINLRSSNHGMSPLPSQPSHIARQRLW